jgi:hypothetical protein
MWHWLLMVGYFSIGYSAAGAVFGVEGNKTWSRIAWALVLGVAGGVAVVAAALVWVLAHELPRLASIPAGVWAFVAGIVVAAVHAFVVARGWVAAPKRVELKWWQGVALFVLGVAVVRLSSGDGPKKEEKVEQLPAAVVAPVAVPEKVGPAAAQACDCASGAVCTGPRGGQYCLDADGKKRYRAAQ